jgi:hypothetical protein
MDDSLAYSALHAVYAELIQMCPFTVGKLVSLEARQELGVPEDSETPLTYGETDFSTLASALARIREVGGGALPQGAFYDLGCGTGKPVFAAALLGGGAWSACRGVEILEGLVCVAEDELLEQWKGGLPRLLRGSKEPTYAIPPGARRTPITFHVGDATQPGECGVDWPADAAVVYACSTCFDEATMGGLASAAVRMAAGTFFCSSGTHLDGPRWELVGETPSSFSWGAGTLFIARRTGAA